MGQKVHPYGFRLGTLYGWQSSWFAGKRYGAQLHEDLKVRAFIKKKLYHAGISKVVIERTGEEKEGVRCKWGSDCDREEDGQG